MKQLLSILLLAFVLSNCNQPSTTQSKSATDTASTVALDTSVMTKDKQSVMTADEALNLLKEGNERFVNNKMIHRDLLHQMHETAEGQYPFAVILSCIDSRTSSEIIFDQGIGDIFNSRVAGNFPNAEILGSMEYSCKVAGSKLIAVIGHSHCGAIKGVCDNVELGNLTQLINEMKPALDSVKDVHGERSSKNHELVEAVAKENVLLAMQAIREKSPVLKEMIDSGQVRLVGGMYDVETGKVTFY